MDAERLLERCKELEAKNASRGEWARWCDQVRAIIAPSFEVCGAVKKRWTSAQVELAYLCGRVESNLLTGWGGTARKSIASARQRQSRIEGGCWDNTTETMKEAAARAHELKAVGRRDYVKTVAAEYDMSPRTVRRWMAKFPPDGSGRT